MAMTWRGRRQLTIFAIVAGAVLFFVYIYASPYLKTQATCFDGRQNGNETGIDCGGSCALICREQTRNMIVRWARAFPVSGGIYTALAYVENQNIGAGVASISYEFKFYDENNIFVAGRKGSTFIGPTGRFLIFEPAINAGNRQILSTLFAFTAEPIWLEIDRRLETFPVFVRDTKLLNPGGSPRLESSIVNDSIYDLFDLDVVAVIYDTDGNAIAASKTFLENLSAGTKQTVFFTWPKSFQSASSRIEVIPQVNPFKIKL